jgi:hypothetical protein
MYMRVPECSSVTSIDESSSLRAIRHAAQLQQTHTLIITWQPMHAPLWPDQTTYSIATAHARLFMMKAKRQIAYLRHRRWRETIKQSLKHACTYGCTRVCKHSGADHMHIHVWIGTYMFMHVLVCTALVQVRAGCCMSIVDIRWLRSTYIYVVLTHVWRSQVDVCLVFVGIRLGGLHTLMYFSYMFGVNVCKLLYAHCWHTFR